MKKKLTSGREKSNLVLENENLKLKLRLEKMKNKRLLKESEENSDLYNDISTYVDGGDLVVAFSYGDDGLNLTAQKNNEGNIILTTDHFYEDLPEVKETFKNINEFMNSIVIDDFDWVAINQDEEEIPLG